MTPVTITFEPHRAGDTWQGIPVIGPVLVNGSAPGAALDRIRMQFRRGSDRGPLALTFDSDPAAIAAGALPITIQDAATWEASVPSVSSVLFPLPPGSYHWDMRFTDSDGIALTFYEGILTVTPGPTDNPPSADA